MQKILDEGASGVTSAELSQALGMDDERGHHSLGIRFAWMRRYGMLDYDEKAHVWTVTSSGERVMEARSRAARVKKAPVIPEEEAVEHIARITALYRLGDPMVATMIRREFMYGTDRRSNVWGASV